MNPIKCANIEALTTINKTDPIKSSSTSEIAEKCSIHVIKRFPTTNKRPITIIALSKVSLRIVNKLSSPSVVKNPMRIKIGITAISWKIKIPVAF